MTADPTRGKRAALPLPGAGLYRFCICGLLTVLIAACINSVAGDFAVAQDPKSESSVYLYGHAVLPPYAVTRTDSTVSINGIQVYPRLPEPLTKPPTRREEKIRDLGREAGEQIRELHLQGLSLEEITPIVADFFRGQTEVDSVGVPGEKLVPVWYRGALFPLEYTIRLPGVPLAKDAQIAGFAERYEISIGPRTLFFLSSGVEQIIPWKRESRRETVQAEIRRAQSFDGPISDLAWGNGNFLTAETAEQLRNPLSLGGTR